MSLEVSNVVEEMEQEVTQQTGRVVSFNDTYNPADYANYKATAVCAEGLVPTLIRDHTGAIAQARAAGIHIVEYGDVDPGGNLVVRNQDDFPRTKDGHLMQWDCVIGVESIAHKQARMDHLNQRARQQLKSVIGEDATQVEGTPSELLALVLAKLTPDKQEALLRVMAKSE